MKKNARGGSLLRRGRRGRHLLTISSRNAIKSNR
nr:MAG TPA: hypothetical protein [Caudoviricetes sp.]